VLEKIICLEFSGVVPTTDGETRNVVIPKSFLTAIASSSSFSSSKENYFTISWRLSRCPALLTHALPFPENYRNSLRVISVTLVIEFFLNTQNWP
jgi:hypothetical protein